MYEHSRTSFQETLNNRIDSATSGKKLPNVKPNGPVGVCVSSCVLNILSKKIRCPLWSDGFTSFVRAI